MTRPLRTALVVLFCALPAAAEVRPPATVFRDCADCPLMVVVPPGDLAFGRFEVTFDEWQACVAGGGCRSGVDDHGWGRGNRPVINVSWIDAVGYADWLSSRTGARYRLPSEAEWEHAARAGSRTAYWWGDEAGRGNANCRGCASPWGGRSTAPAGSFPANPFGLFDLNGNVWEWTADCISEPPSGRECRERAVRGGSWYYLPRLSSADSRSANAAGQGSYNIGFRLVRELP